MGKKKIGKYVVDLGKLLGKGSFAEVYKGIIAQTNEQIAVKVVQKCYILEDEYTKNAFEQQIRIMMKLKSQNIIRILDVNETKSNFYVILQIANQGTLRDIIKSRKSNSQLLTENQTINYVIQLLNGFAEMFKFGVIHRDIKPENVFVKDGKLKIGDFGFAKNDKSLGSMMSTIVGSPAYMAPQILKKQKYTYKCDIWSLGVMTYQLLVGQLPFNFKSIQFKQDFDQDGKAIFNKVKETVINFPENLNVSENIKDFIRGCLRINENERFDWLKVFLHPVFKGIFNKNFEGIKKGEQQLAYIMGQFRMALNQYKIDIFLELMKIKKQSFIADQFLNLLKYFNPNISKDQSATLLQILLKNDKVGLQDFQKLLTQYQCHHIKPISNDSIIKSGKMKFALIKTLIGKKNRQEQINFKDYLPQSALKTGKISLKEFILCLKAIVPQVPDYIIPDFYMQHFGMMENEKLPVNKFLDMMKKTVIDWFEENDQ